MRALLLALVLVGCENRRPNDPPCRPAPAPCECLHWPEYGMQAFALGGHYLSAEKFADNGCRAEGPYAPLLPR